MAAIFFFKNATISLVFCVQILTSKTLNGPPEIRFSEISGRNCYALTIFRELGNRKKLNKIQRGETLKFRNLTSDKKCDFRKLEERL